MDMQQSPSKMKKPGKTTTPGGELYSTPIKGTQTSPHRNVVLQKQFSNSPSKTHDHLTVAQIAKKFNLVSTFETLEGHETLPLEELKGLLEYSTILARD